MDIFETRLIRVRRIFRFIVPILFAAVLCLIFYLGIARTQTDSLEKEQVTLTQALEGGAIRTYALTGRYPESLDEFLRVIGNMVIRKQFIQALRVSACEPG